MLQLHAEVLLLIRWPVTKYRFGASKYDVLAWSQYKPVAHQVHRILQTVSRSSSLWQPNLASGRGACIKSSVGSSLPDLNPQTLHLHMLRRQSEQRNLNKT